ncbi:hypothetical protein GACE_1768 [Geoglobus acetivorans]|uniref:Uncharacterized protein n=2 Tax=Geoglobus acetivorans TaxID=565033 RepID=A0A0A7GIT2_GEOAI|nr:hypothetical protein GACE_1768 [Geoglobus acetivorans]
MSDGMGEVSDIYEFVTKILNPRLNHVIGLLQSHKSNKRNLEYRVDSISVRWRPVEELIIGKINDWRDGIYKKYGNREFELIKRDFLKDYHNLILNLYPELKKLDISLSKEVFENLYELGRVLEQQLTGYIELFSYYNVMVEQDINMSNLKEKIAFLERSLREMEEECEKLVNRIGDRGGKTRVEDFHDLITKLINPKLNNVIGLLYGHGGIEEKTNRVDYTTVKHSTIEAHLAKEIEEWRDEIYKKYNGKNLLSIKEELIEDYYKFFKQLYDKLMRINRAIAKDVFQILYVLGENLEESLSGEKTHFSVYDMIIEKNKEISKLKNSIIVLENKIKEKKSLINDMSSEYKKYGKSQFKKGIALGFIMGIAVMSALVYLLFL